MLAYNFSIWEFQPKYDYKVMSGLKTPVSWAKIFAINHGRSQKKRNFNDT